MTELRSHRRIGEGVVAESRSTGRVVETADPSLSAQSRGIRRLGRIDRVDIGKLGAATGLVGGLAREVAIGVGVLVGLDELRSTVAAVAPYGHERIAKVGASRLAGRDTESVGIHGVIAVRALARDQGSGVTALPSGWMRSRCLRCSVDRRRRVVKLKGVCSTAGQARVTGTSDSTLRVGKHLPALECVVTVALVSVPRPGKTVAKLVAVGLALFRRKRIVGECICPQRKLAVALRKASLVSGKTDGTVSRRVRVVGQVERIEVVVVAASLGAVALAWQRAKVIRDKVPSADGEIASTVTGRVTEGGPLGSLVDTCLAADVASHRV